MSSKSFNLYGKKIVISQAYDYYNSIRLRFESEAQKAANEFMRRYNAYGSIENFVKRGFDDGMEIVEEIIDRLVIKKS